MQEMIISRVARALELGTAQVDATVELLDEGCTVPFIARYRKERTGELDEVQIRAVEREIERVRQLEDRRAAILGALQEQGVSDGKLLGAIGEAQTLTRLEDLYAPYRPKRRTRAQKAVEAGLEPLARAIFEDQRGAVASASRYVGRGEAPVASAQEALDGARDIIAERVADDAVTREDMRERLRRHGRMVSAKKRGAEEDPKFKLYAEGFEAPLRALRPHQLLAMRRGEAEGALSVKCAGDDARWIEDLCRFWANVRDPQNRKLIEDAVADGYSRLLMPRTERDVRGELEADADAHAIGVFALNLKHLLLSAPMPDRRVLGVDPGLRTGCKLAVVGETGDVLEVGTCYIHDRRSADAPEAVARLIRRHGVELVAVGNGTGSREAQEAVAAALKLVGGTTRYAVVDEAGASVYSASDLAREEFPDMDVSLRGAVSIARRLQDPLAELIKIDPRSIGVGMYQHDVNQKELERALAAVVEDVVNAVGVDLNTASPALLTHISGLSASQAASICAHRAANGAFTSRQELGRVRGIGPKTFEQAAGFLRVRGGSEPLDNTGIHPERYALARDVLRAVNAHAPAPSLRGALDRALAAGKLDALASRHGVGAPTLRDIIDDLTAPGRDPRRALEPPPLRADVLTLDDLTPGMRLRGVVRNVLDFGAFIDLGVKQDGLVHISELAEHRVRSPYEVVHVGQTVEVRVLEVDHKRQRIGLSMRP